MLKNIFLFGKGTLGVVSLQCNAKQRITQIKGLPIEIGVNKRLFNTKN